MGCPWKRLNQQLLNLSKPGIEREIYKFKYCRKYRMCYNKIITQKESRTMPI